MTALIAVEMTETLYEERCGVLHIVSGDQVMMVMMIMMIMMMMMIMMIMCTVPRTSSPSSRRLPAWAGPSRSGPSAGR